MIDEKPILREIAGQFREMREGFNLLRDIDKHYLDNKLTIRSFMEWLLSELIDLFKLKSGSIYGYRDNSLVLIYTIPVGDRNLIQKLDNNHMSNKLVNGNVVILDEDDNINGSAMLIPLKLSGKVKFVISLFDSISIKSASPLSEKRKVEFSNILSNQASIFFDHREELREKKITDNLVNEFFRSELNPAKCWKTIVEHVSSYLPDWEPYKIEPAPLVQLLSYGRKDDAYLVIQASQNEKSVSGTLRRNHSLPINNSVCGLVIENDLSYLNVNPQEEYREIYKAFLYGKLIPQSELVIPIKDKDGVKGLINLEHRDKGVFTDYHVSRLLVLSEYLSPFFSALIKRERIQRKKEIGLQYVITNLLKRMGETFQHKMGHAFNRTEYALTWISDNLLETNDEAKNHFDRLNYSFNEMRERTRAFMADLPEFIKFSRIDLCQMINEAISEFDFLKMRKNENIDLDVAPIKECPIVFGSKMIKEHFYNVLVNACEAIIIKKENEAAFVGNISVTIHKESVIDAFENKTSPDRYFVSIKDNAGGIPDELQKKVAEFGYSSKRERGGTGYGLPAAIEYMETIKGGMTYENIEWDKGYGCNITFYVEEYDPKFHDNLIVMS